MRLNVPKVCRQFDQTNDMIERRSAQVFMQ